MGVTMRYGSGGEAGNASASKSGGVVAQKLWINQNPTSNFAAQSVSVDLTGFDYCEIQLRFSTSNNYATEIKRFPVDEQPNQLTIVTLGQNRTGGRHVTYSIANKQLTFDAASYNGATNNAYAIPLCIWGVKL